MSISHKGSENSALHLVASLSTETGSVALLSTCSKEAVSWRGLRCSMSSLRMGGLEAKMCASVTWSSLPSQIHPSSCLVSAWSSALAWYRYCGVRPVEVEGATGAAGVGGRGGGEGSFAGGTVDAFEGFESFFFIAKTSYMSYSSVVYSSPPSPASESASSVMYAPVETAGSGMISKL